MARLINTTGETFTKPSRRTTPRGTQYTNTALRASGITDHLSTHVLSAPNCTETNRQGNKSTFFSPSHSLHLHTAYTKQIFYLTKLSLELSHKGNRFDEKTGTRLVSLLQGLVI